MDQINELVHALEAKGFIVPANARFFKKGEKFYMYVGSYHHSCHIDSTEFYALLTKDGKLIDGNDMWWREVFKETI